VEIELIRSQEKFIWVQGTIRMVLILQRHQNNYQIKLLAFVLSTGKQSSRGRFDCRIIGTESRTNAQLKKRSAIETIKYHQ